MNITYEARGVSPDKPDVKAAVAQLDKGLFPGAFCHAMPDILGGSPDHCILSHADGAGTKSILAYLHYKQHGDPKIFRGIAQDSLVMNTDDLLCVGALGPFMLSNTIGRNKMLIPGEIVTEIVTGYKQVVEMLGGHGVEIVIAGGETADVGDLVRTVIVDSTLTVRMRQADFIDAAQVKPGQVIVGLASDGQATYEDRPNSGIGSNGITAIRHEMLDLSYRDYTEAYAPEISHLAYVGQYALTDAAPGLNMTIGEALLSPTRTYAPVIKAILSEGREDISAIFHNTGGGQTKCLNFGSGIRYVKDDIFPEAPLFKLIRETRALPYREMLRTFNMGYRMEIVCDESRAASIIAHAKRFGIAAKIYGRTEKSAGANELIVTTPEGTITFPT
jgi:phosphoribosylformylglycinamidine cyclo-ligase